MWNCLGLKEVNGKYIRLIRDMYEDSKATVRSVACTTESFLVKLGLHQGSELILFLYAIVIYCLTSEVQRPASGDMLFADDVAVNGETSGEEVERLEE